MRRWAWTVLLWLLLLVAPFAMMGAVNSWNGPSTHARESTCTRFCHDHGCPHRVAGTDASKISRNAERLYLENIRLLKASPLGYRNTNLLVYLAGFPSLFALLLLAVLRPGPHSDATRQRYGTLGVAAVVALALALAAQGSLRDWGPPSLRAAYWYCTDFCIHAANALGIAYDTFNFLLFVVGFPAAACTLAVAAVARLRPAPASATLDR